jgi:ApaG protein
MVTEITQGIQVSVDTHYQPELSHPAREHFVFTYRIKIENRSSFTIQLLRRRWQIFDGTGICRQVEGDGVLGLQPVLEPGEVHEYVSGCNLRTTIGKMMGTYEMVRIVDQKEVLVAIPEFTMVAPFRLN